MANTPSDIPLLANFAESTLEAELDIAGLVATIPAADASLFPEPAAGEMYRATIWDGDATHDPEIIECSSNPLTGAMAITRAIEGTVARTWPAGSIFRLAPTAEILSLMASQSVTGIYWYTRNISGNVTIPTGYGAIFVGATISGDLTVEAGAIGVALSDLTVTGTTTVDPTGELLDFSGGTADFQDFNTTLSAALYKEGRLFYDTDTKTLNYYNDISGVTMNLGEELWLRVVNKTGVTITDGSVVYVSGAQGQRPTIALARADARATSDLIGVVTVDIADNAEGIVTLSGLVRDLDTSSFTDGDQIWLSDTTAGTFTATKPDVGADSYAVYVGHVISAHATQGIIDVRTTEPLDSTDIVPATAAEIIAKSDKALMSAADYFNHPLATKAWVVFDGTELPSGLLTILNGENVVSVNKTVSGTYTITWAVTFADTNYCVDSSCAGNGRIMSYNPASTSTTQMTARTDAGAVVDPFSVSVSVKGPLA
jgi:hypothetical protein